MLATPRATAAPYARSHPRSAASPALQTVPRRGGVYDVAPEVLGVKTAIVNLYLVGAPGSSDWVLVDAGMRGYAGRIQALAERRFGKVPPRAIVLTHGHFDHVGSLQALLKIWDVPVYAHHAELPFLTGRASYPPPDPTVGGGGLMSWSGWTMPTGPIDLGARVHAFPVEGELPELPGWKIISTPGHTPGHVSLFREEDRVLLAGDAFVTLHAESLIANLTLTPRVQRPPAYFTPDWPAARLSVQKLAELAPEVVATGHGQPLRGEGMRQALSHLAYEFETHSDGLPAHGRYREVPALFNEATGTTRLPPVPVLPYVIAASTAIVVVGVIAAALAHAADD